MENSAEDCGIWYVGKGYLYTAAGSALANPLALVERQGCHNTALQIWSEQARSGNDASSDYLFFVERIYRILHIAVLIDNIAFHGLKCIIL